MVHLVPGLRGETVDLAPGKLLEEAKGRLDHLIPFGMIPIPQLAPRPLTLSVRLICAPCHLACKAASIFDGFRVFPHLSRISSPRQVRREARLGALYWLHQDFRLLLDDNPGNQSSFRGLELFRTERLAALTLFAPSTHVRAKNSTRGWTPSKSAQLTRHREVVLPAH